MVDVVVVAIDYCLLMEMRVKQIQTTKMMKRKTMKKKQTMSID